MVLVLKTENIIISRIRIYRNPSNIELAVAKNGRYLRSFSSFNITLPKLAAFPVGWIKRCQNNGETSQAKRLEGLEVVDDRILTFSLQ